MNVAVTRGAEGFPRRAFSVDDIRRMIDIGLIGPEENRRAAGLFHPPSRHRLSRRVIYYFACPSSSRITRSTKAFSGGKSFWTMLQTIAASTR